MASRPLPPEAGLELGDLDERERGRLRLPAAASDASRIAWSAPTAVSGQLPRVRDTRVRGQPGPQVHHRLKRSESLVVATQLDERVPDHAVRTARPR